MKTSPAPPDTALIEPYVVRLMGWMCVGLFVSSLVALTVAEADGLVRLFAENPVLDWLLFGVQFIIAWILWATLENLSVRATQRLFLLYSAISGLSLTSLALGFSSNTLATSFWSPAGMFGSVALFGFLFRWEVFTPGVFFSMPLIGWVIAGASNAALGSSPGEYALSFASVFAFWILLMIEFTALQRRLESAERKGDVIEKEAVFGAFLLYLSLLTFVNRIRDLLRRPWDD